MTSEIKAAIEQNDFQRVKVLVEAIVEQVSYAYIVLVLIGFSTHRVRGHNNVFRFLIIAHKHI